MELLHKKSQCCGAKIIRFGGKRRQCTACKKTWRVRSGKRGPKPKRKKDDYLDKVFIHGFTVKQLGLNSQLSSGAIYKRFSKNVDRLVAQERTVKIKGDRLILIIDAQWQYFKGKLWTIYLLAIKPIGTDSAVILDPILKEGRENSSFWKEVIDQLEPSIKNRIIAVVCDGIRGMDTVAENNDWLIQRCHFHLLSSLQKMRGKRASTYGRQVREEIYYSVKLALVETSSYRLNKLCRRLAELAQDPGCPKKMRMLVRDFLRRFPEFRTYLEYPEFAIPTTVNVMESINSFTRRKSRTVNSPKTWHKWTLAAIRYKSIFTCK